MTSTLSRPPVGPTPATRPAATDRYEVVTRIVDAWASEPDGAPLEPVVAQVAPEATPAEVARATLEIRLVFAVDRSKEGRFVPADRPRQAPPTPLDGLLDVARAALADLASLEAAMGPPAPGPVQAPGPAPPGPAAPTPASRPVAPLSTRLVAGGRGVDPTRPRSTRY